MCSERFQNQRAALAKGGCRVCLEVTTWKTGPVMPRYTLHDTLTFALADGGELVVEHGSTVFFDRAPMAGMKALQGSHPRSYNHAGLKALLKPSSMSGPLMSGPLKIVPESERHKPPIVPR